MKQLQLRNGDLVVGPGGLGMVRGADKVRQDLGAMVREAIGTDRFHPRWGTVLPDFVGRESGVETSMLIRGELSRLLQNYMVMQTRQVEADMAANRPPRFVPEELVTNVTAIQLQQRIDRFNVKVSVRTLAGEDVTLLRTVQS